jgi:hypothetical protein
LVVLGAIVIAEFGGTRPSIVEATLKLVLAVGLYIWVATAWLWPQAVRRQAELQYAADESWVRDLIMRAGFGNSSAIAEVVRYQAETEVDSRWQKARKVFRFEVNAATAELKLVQKVGEICRLHRVDCQVDLHQTAFDDLLEVLAEAFDGAMVRYNGPERAYQCGQQYLVLDAALAELASGLEPEAVERLVGSRFNLDGAIVRQEIVRGKMAKLLLGLIEQGSSAGRTYIQAYLELDRAGQNDTPGFPPVPPRPGWWNPKMVHVYQPAEPQWFDLDRIPDTAAIGIISRLMGIAHIPRELRPWDEAVQTLCGVAWALLRTRFEDSGLFTTTEKSALRRLWAETIPRADQLMASSGYPDATDGALLTQPPA